MRYLGGGPPFELEKHPDFETHFSANPNVDDVGSLLIFHTRVVSLKIADECASADGDANADANAMLGAVRRHATSTQLAWDIPSVHDAGSFSVSHLGRVPYWDIPSVVDVERLPRSHLGRVP